jgi:phosphocarrier protein HPr
MADSRATAGASPVLNERWVRIQNRAGMHARPAAAFVKLAAQYKASVRVARGALEVDGKSIMGVLMLAAEQGTELRISAQGDDAEAVVDALVNLILSGFGEGEEVI